MARKKSKKRSWAKTLLIYLCIPIATWFIAFLLWFYWPDLTGTAAQKERAAPAGKVNRGASTPAQRPQENILDEDRKRLDDILKRRG